MKSLRLIPLALVVLTCGLVAQGKPVPQFQIPAIREPHHFVKLDNRYVRVLDGTIGVEAQGLPVQRVATESGEFDWHTGPLAHTITNVGTARFEAIEAVWK